MTESDYIRAGNLFDEICTLERVLGRWQGEGGAMDGYVAPPIPVDLLDAVRQIVVPHIEAELTKRQAELEAL